MLSKTAFDIESLWEHLLPPWSGLVGERVTLDRAAALGAPEAWMDLIDPLSRGPVLDREWQRLPRFCGYLRASLLDVRIFCGVLGPVLVYLLRDWRETDLDCFEPGLMIGGAPEPADDIEAFEASVGAIPDTLRLAWMAHTFLRVKNGRWLASIQPRFAPMFGTPLVHPRPLLGWVDGEHDLYECLEIFDPGSGDISGCLVRKRGERMWRDRIAYREGTDALMASHRATLDATLSDWELSEWSAPGNPDPGEPSAS